MDFFVMPPEEATWSISSEDFKRALESTWPGATAKVVSHFGTSVEFEIPMRHYVLCGRLDDTGRVFTFEKGIHDCAVFAVWIRSLVPSQRRLIFCDEGYSHDVELFPETTAEDILRAFQVAPG